MSEFSKRTVPWSSVATRLLHHSARMRYSVKCSLTLSKADREKRKTLIDRAQKHETSEDPIRKTAEKKKNEMNDIIELLHNTKQVNIQFGKQTENR